MNQIEVKRLFYRLITGFLPWINLDIFNLLLKGMKYMLNMVRWSLFLFGLIFFSIGICLAINVQYLGVQAWDTLHVALYDKFGLSIGTWAIIIGLFLVGITWVLDKSYIKIGTFLNIFIVGLFVDLFLWLDFLPQASDRWTDVLIILTGIVLMGLAGGMYNAAGVGSGPRDGFMLAVSYKWNIPIGRMRIITETGIVLLGFILGGPVFLFTFLFTLIQSPLFQYSYLKIKRFVDRFKINAIARA